MLLRSHSSNVRSISVITSRAARRWARGPVEGRDGPVQQRRVDRQRAHPDVPVLLALQSRDLGARAVELRGDRLGVRVQRAAELRRHDAGRRAFEQLRIHIGFEQAQALGERRLRDVQGSGRTVALASVKLLPPVIPPTFYAAGINYRTQVENARAKGLATQVPTQADIGYRAVNALIGPGDAIAIPRGSTGKVEFEAELVVVIGRKAKHLSPQDALSCVFGYTIGNDASERTWQRGDRTFWRGKNTDTFKPMGPWIETDVDLDQLVTTVRLNDREVSRFKTQRHDLRHRALHQHDDSVPHAVAGRCDLDGHRRPHARDGGRRHGRGRDRERRRTAQLGGERMTGRVPGSAAAVMPRGVRRARRTPGF